jgi:DNA-binding transcriptional LysR family regulator
MHNIKIDLNLFIVFEAIYSEASITRAAEVLHLTQPAVSHALNRLRDALGDDLFLRTSKGMRPTPYAKQLIGTVRQSLGQLQRGLQTGRIFEPGQLTTVFRLCLRELFEVMLLPELVNQCRLLAPAVSFNCLRVPRHQIQHDLASGRIDLAADVLMSHDADIKHKKLSGDHFVCLLRSQHPALKAAWNVAEMLAWPHILVSSREHGQGFEDIQLARHGLERRIGLRVPQYLGAGLVLTQSDMLLCAPARFATVLTELLPLTCKPFPVDLAELEIYLYWHHSVDKEPAHQWLRELVEKVWLNIAV